MAIKGGANKACAACKYQRRRCSKECPLSPYFPADQPKKFQNAHRLFGVSNIMKTLNQVHPEQQDEAMESIIFESDMRAKYPVNGCLGIIWQYQYQINKLEEELRLVKIQLAIYKDHCQYQLPYSMPPSSPDCSLVSPQQLQFGMSTTTSDPTLPLYNNFQNNNVEFSMLDGNGVYNSSGYIESEDIMMKSLSVQQSFCNGMSGQPNLMAMQDLSNQQELDINPEDYEDIPFDAIADDKQSFIECKEPCESSVESSFQEAAKHLEIVSQDELKSAAACFRLTTIQR